MIQLNSNNIHWIQFAKLSHFDGLVHFVSTRKGGRSLAPFASLNLGFANDNPPSVIENRKLLAAALGFTLEQFVFQEQIHSCTVKIVGASDAGAGVLGNETRIPESDAMVTNKKGICLMAMAADCVPVLLFDPQTRTVAAVHAGWKGTVGKIAKAAVEVMILHFGVKPSDVVAGIGPSISPWNYEVGENVVTQVQQNFEQHLELLPIHPQTGKHHFDLWKANQAALLEAGLNIENIEIAGLCTVDHPELFFSHRRDNGQTGRFCGGIMLC